MAKRKKRKNKNCAAAILPLGMATLMATTQVLVIKKREPSYEPQHTEPMQGHPEPQLTRAGWLGASTATVTTLSGDYFNFPFDFR
jgi:hypothetical protein